MSLVSTTRIKLGVCFPHLYGCASFHSGTFVEKRVAHMSSSIAELACGIICGCLPTCPTFFQVVYSKLRPKEGRNIYSRDRMSKVGRFKSTLGSGSHSRGLRRWDRPFGSTAALNNDQYLELGQRYATPEHQIAVQQRGQEENLAMPNGIRKTVRLEQSAQ